MPKNLAFLIGKAGADAIRHWVLGDNIGGQLVFDPGNRVFQRQLLLFQAAQAQLIRPPAVFQRMDGFIKVPVFGFENLKLDAQHVFGFHFFGFAHDFESFPIGQNSLRRPREKAKQKSHPCAQT